MNLQLDGTIIDVMPSVNGISKNGKQWQKQEFVVETSEQYPRKICFSLFGGKVEEMSHLIQVNNLVTVYFDIESHEYNGRWFTNINAYSIKPIGQADPSQSTMPLSPMEKAGSGFSNQQPEPQPEIPPLTDVVSPDPDDDLPF